MGIGWFQQDRSTTGIAHGIESDGKDSCSKRSFAVIEFPELDHGLQLNQAGVVPGPGIAHPVLVLVNISPENQGCFFGNRLAPGRGQHRNHFANRRVAFNPVQCRHEMRSGQPHKQHEQHECGDHFDQRKAACPPSGPDRIIQSSSN